jgi:hypothetical protein
MVAATCQKGLKSLNLLCQTTQKSPRWALAPLGLFCLPSAHLNQFKTFFGIRVRNKSIANVIYLMYVASWK